MKPVGGEQYTCAQSEALISLFTTKELIAELRKRGVLQLNLYHQTYNTRLWNLVGQYQEEVKE